MRYRELPIIAAGSSLVLTCSASILFKLASALAIIASFVDGVGITAPDHLESISNDFAISSLAMISS